MPESTTSFLFPDINVWIALTYQGHIHHGRAAEWFSTIPGDSRLFFCRFTQLGFLRLLTAEAVMGDELMNRRQAWQTYDLWLQDDRVACLDEPSGLERIFRNLTRLRRPATKDWADSYLCAFASASQLSLVTFDRSLSRKASNSRLLSA
jgi:toxin-antitoxin system PIN domain toxin